MSTDDHARFLEDGDADNLPAQDREALARVRGLLADETLWASAPEGADELVAAIAAEAEVAPQRRGTHRRLLAAVSAVAAVAAVLVISVVTFQVGPDGGGASFAVAGTELAPDAHGVVEVEETGSGVALSLTVEGLAPAPPGSYYQAWLRGPRGLVTIGTFHLRGGDDTVELWSGVDIDRYPTLTVTLQEEGGGQESSGQVVISGELTTD